MLTHAYGFVSSTSPCSPTQIERREPGPKDVLIDIAYCGVCHSDIHTARGEWGRGHYPLVVGHEITGTVRAVGAQVTACKPGDRVGVGCMVDSCGECEFCAQGLEQFCDHAIFTYNSRDQWGQTTQGGYSQAITVQEHFVFSIPDSIALDEGAPLLCAGITTYSPLKRWVQPGMKVAIVGLGGLGHVGVQIAAALGADVSIISHTMSKQADGLALGANAYYATAEAGTFKHLANQFDMILSTVSSTDDYTSYINCLNKTGVLVNVGMPAEAVDIHVRALSPLRTLQGSLIGGCLETQEMLDFCAEHQVRPRIETITGDQITDAYDKVVRSQVRYRYVIDANTLGQR
ncbi:MAG: NAD(P)-dependent alcohol dehydrogenase [Propionibacteriaceae bacterium]|nr:NAD(P)-dependent alcohol dehydrogenase [Propionibacteriaceae bacterium]